MEEDNNDKIKSKEQEFIVETPIVIEQKINNTDKVFKYERGKFLGKGGFAKCYEMKCVDTGVIYAAKLFEKKALNKARSRKKLINEIKLHKKLHHPNIVNFVRFFEDKENVYILLELCSNQTLNELVKRRKRLSEIETQCYLIQIINALKYLHNHKIIHRDLKLGNLFLTKKLELKLGDFGLAAKLEYEGQRRRTLCGTPNYIAPEILEKKNGHSYEVDIWSLGVVAYTMLFGKPPFETAEVNMTYRRIKMNSYTFPENIKVDPSAKKLISSILNLDPSKRPSLNNILEHDFFKMYHSVPLLMPISTLACPPSKAFIASYSKNEVNLINNERLKINNDKLTSFRKSDISNTERNDEEEQHDEANLKRLEDNFISQTYLLNSLPSAVIYNNNTLAPPVLNFFGKKISKFFDYSSKFGFVYFINNTDIGICFTDFSNIIKNMCKDKESATSYDYIYLERDAQKTQNYDEVGLENYLGGKNTSKEIVKKFDIFKRVVEKHKAEFDKMKDDSKYSKNDEGNCRLFFVKRYMTSKNATLFRLSNKLIQIVFTDTSEIIFSTETNDFIYKDTKGEEMQKNIQIVMSNDSNKELIKKIKLAKNMMIYFVKSHKSKKLPK